MNDTNFYISLIIATCLFAIVTGGTVFRGAIGPVERQPLPDLTAQNLFDRPRNSPFKNEVKIGYVSNPGTTREFVSLYINGRGSDIVVAGWKVRSTISGKSVTIENTTLLPGQISGPLNLPALTPAGTLIRTNSCAAYIGQGPLAYNSCVATYINSTDFLTPEWRLFSGPQKSLWSAQHDNLQLLDAQGLLVSEYAYNL